MNAAVLAASPPLSITERAEPIARSGGGEAAAPERAGPGAAPASADPAGADPSTADSAEQAFQLWRERVWRFASRVGVPSEALEDATQDVFTAVCRRWNDFQGLSTRRTWVLGFVPKIAARYRRRRGADQSLPSAEREPTAAGAEVAGTLEHDPFESAARREAQRLVHAFLERLGALDRQLFVLVDLEEVSVVDAAAILEIGTRRAYKKLERIRRALEAELVRQRAIDSRRLR